MRNVISNFAKRGTLSFMSAVLALSTLTPVLNAQTATAIANGPFTVESVCDVDGTVNYNFSVKQTGLTVGNLYYKTPYGNSPKHTLDFFDTDKWSVKTNLGTAPSVNVDAEVRGYLFNSLIKKYSVATDPLSCSKLNAEEFVTVDGSYKGISVGFNVKDFGTATAASVTIERADGSTVIKTANQGVLDLISNATATTQLTAPIVIQEGTFTEASDTFYWAPAPATWTDATAPVKATISVTDQYGTKTVENTIFNQGSPSWPTYQSLLPVAPATPSTQVITGDTGTENQAGKWMFNRDQTTKTPFVFATGNPSVGSGSVFIQPIGNTNVKDKFIAEYFAQTNLDTLDSFSFDFKLGSATVNPNQFYLNVYANFGSSSATKFYDCRYNVVATVGSATDYTTLTFDPTQNHSVSTHGSSAHMCPSKPADMETLSSGSIIRAFAINVGDTSASDAGVSGYLDNAVLSTVTDIVTFDFEKAVVTDGGNNNPGSGSNGGSNSNSTNTTTGNRTTTPAPVFAVADIFGINKDAEEATIGTASNDEGGEVAGATDNKDDKGCGIFLGICWYYWIPIVLAILAVVYAVRRRLQANNA